MAALNHIDIELSKFLPVPEFSNTFKAPKVWRINFGKKEKALVNQKLEIMRATHYSDKGLGYVLVEVEAMSEGAQDYLFYLASNIQKNNVLGLDIYVSRKMKNDVKKVIGKINQLIEDTGTTSIRIIKDRYKSQVRMWQVLFIVFGIILAIGGMMIQGQEIILRGSTFPNIAQLLGFILVLIGAAPSLYELRTIITSKELKGS